jgi:glycosyltransferase involved in cell wall biosynthesis
MRVLCVVEHGNAPSIRLRLRDCLARYQDLGFEVTTLATQRSKPSAQWKILRAAPHHDVVVLFKTIGFSALELRLLRRANPRIVFDFDDAIMFREVKYEQPLNGRYFKKFVRTMKVCAAAAAGNRFLAAMAEACGVKATVLPTSIDLPAYRIKQHHDGVSLTIGWLGLSDGLRYLRSIQPALLELSQRHPGFQLKVISDKPLDLEGVRVVNESWQAEKEQDQLASFDIGIMPLWDSIWTRGKCGFKILQYMAAGLPVVASDVGVNGEIITHGQNGYLAREQADWIEGISQLVQSAEQRRTFGLRGRQLVEQKYSLEGYATRYAELLRGVSGRTNQSTS